ncbi:MAG TPA: hypothetical protein VGK73_00620 [Polyangiaceae bacterium]
MTYRPAETSFGPPFVAHLPSLLYLSLAVAAVIAVFVAEQSEPGSFLYNQIVERSVRGFVSARAVAALLVFGALASLIRTSMRGVRIRGDGLEFRDVVTLGIPRLRRFRWAQIDRILLDAASGVVLELWDGSRAYMPEVSDRAALSVALEKVAHARAIPVRGGAGLDELPEAGELGDEQA